MTMTASTIEPQQVHQAIENKEPARLIDVRTPGEYASEHVEQAESMPLDQLDPEALKADNGAPLYLFCRTGNRAAQASEKLTAAGLADVRVVEGGLEGWKQAGLPVKRGKGVISLERQVRIGAGALVLIGVLLGWFVHPGLHAIALFVGGGLMFAGITDWCGMAMVLAKLPWNRRGTKPDRGAGGDGGGATCST
ncbi:rhodanese-like domain-containing protein [Phycisphaerales bacterium AB-hyl4]|uniref:Rhodanese-like domain-containing protein n=1 Tax=Natronomicrosphaera hydrolytica TaxID=3242702 RepID=A0ABV4U9H7_9BACT